MFFSRNLEKILGKILDRQIVSSYTTAPEAKTEIKGTYQNSKKMKK